MKMPATTNTKDKVEAKPSTDLGDAAKQCLNCLEKKMRNLEKRKGRIEQNQDKAKKGVKLEKEQEDSLGQYDQVMHSLEFAKEVHKQFLQINQEHEKMTRKQAKREKAERQATEIKRIGEILQLQSLLDMLGQDAIRQDFKTGKSGAVVLTEDSLNKLDELYQVISPSRDDSGDTYSKLLNSAAEHLVNFLDGKDRQVVGTTYKELKDLISLILECGYFQQAKPAEAVEAAEPAEEEAEVDTEEVSTESVEGTQEADIRSEEQQQQVPVDLTVPTLTESTPSLRELPAAQTLSSLEQEQFLAPSSLPYQAELEPHFSQAGHAAPARIPDYPSFTNGPFQFIQASYVMPESTAPALVDPAVIVAQPAVNSGLPYMARYEGQPHIASQIPQQTQPQIPQSYNPQSYSQNLPPNSLFSVQGVGEVPVTIAQHPSIMGQLREDTVSSPYEIPPSIPMPPTQSQDQTSQQQLQALDKKFPMNVSAPVFQSMYSQAPDVPGGLPVSSSLPQNLATETQIPISSAEFSSTDRFGQTGSGDFQQSSQGGTFSNSSHGTFSNSSHGFQRSHEEGGSSDSGSGGQGDRPPIQNGYSGRGRGGPGGRGGRGSGYQGYSTPYNNRQEGYQGNYNSYKSRFSSGGGPYPKRGAGAGVGSQGSGGFSRGGGVGGGEGGVAGRGGPREGISRGGAPTRRPARGNLSRPVATQ